MKKKCDKKYDLNQKVEDFIKMKGMNPNEFSKSIGNARSDNIYNIIKKEVEVSPKMINRIAEKYPEFREYIVFGSTETTVAPKTTSKEAPPQDDRLFDLVVSQQETIKNLTEINKNLSETNKQLSELLEAEQSKKTSSGSGQRKSGLRKAS